MKKLCILLAAVLALMLAACSAPASSTPASSAPASAPDSGAFPRFEAGLADLGISCSERVTMDATYIGGEAGYKYQCKSYKIELYQCDPESDAYKKAESEGIVTLEGFGDFSVLAHDGLVLLDSGSLPQEVIDLFNSL